MILYSKCSFRSGHGYQMSMCSMDYNCSTSLLPLKDHPLPEPVDFLFNIDFSNTVILATADVEKYLFLAIMGVSDNNSEKYINAVICDPKRPENILKIFSLFVNHYQASIADLVNCFERAVTSDSASNVLDYTINTDRLIALRRDSEQEKDLPTTYYLPQNTIFAFITQHNYSDYQPRLDSHFLLRESSQSLLNGIAPDRSTVDCSAVYKLLGKRPSASFMLNGRTPKASKRKERHNPLEKGAEALLSAIDPFRKKK